MTIARKPMCKRHKRQYAHTCTHCEREFREKQINLWESEDDKEGRETVESIQQSGDEGTGESPVEEESTRATGSDRDIEEETREVDENEEEVPTDIDTDSYFEADYLDEIEEGLQEEEQEE
jgi:hypothetical protein